MKFYFGIEPDIVIVDRSRNMLIVLAYEKAFCKEGPLILCNLKYDVELAEKYMWYRQIPIIEDSALARKISEGSEPGWVIPENTYQKVADYMCDHLGHLEEKRKRWGIED